MLFFRKNDPDTVRPLAPASKVPPPTSIDDLQSTRFYKEAVSYLKDYPPRSLMSDDSRAVLFSLIRILRPTYIAEIGTLMAGTTEVMARACWENNWGIVHTTDPFGGERCPPIIASWPQDLQKYVSFQPLPSMSFFADLDQRRIPLDLVLIDGNHDYEFALFDLLMAARLIRPSGTVIMDNAEQSGPYNAARTFLLQNPQWRELGSAIADHDPSNPFDASRASMPGTTFIVLQAPAWRSISELPRSWGQASTSTPRLTGLVFTLAGPPTSGTLHYQAIFRAFFEDGTSPVEEKAIGHIRIDRNSGITVAHSFDKPMLLPADARCTIETDLSWQPDPSAPPLGLAGPPEPLND